MGKSVFVDKTTETQEYGNVAVKTGVEYYRVNIMECDYIVETKEKDNGTSKIIIEPVL